MSTEAAVQNPTPTTADVLETMSQSFSTLYDSLSQFNADNRALQQQVKSIYKDYRR